MNWLNWHQPHVLHTNTNAYDISQIVLALSSARSAWYRDRYYCNPRRPCKRPMSQVATKSRDKPSRRHAGGGQLVADLSLRGLGNWRSGHHKLNWLTSLRMLRANGTTGGSPPCAMAYGVNRLTGAIPEATCSLLPLGAACCRSTIGPKGAEGRRNGRGGLHKRL